MTRNNVGMSASEKPREKDGIAICPECKAKNIVPAPETRDLDNPKLIPLLVTFDCFKCKQRVAVLLAELKPLTDLACGGKD